MKKNLTLSFFLILLGGIACNQRSVHTPTGKERAQHEENLIKANKYLIKKDSQLIAGYVKRHQWEMTLTQTGLWYMIYEKGKGPAVEKGMVVTLTYQISLLDGSSCYSSDSAGPKSFRVSQGGVESGLEEGVLYLHQGDRARFIMPPHLAYGLVGDQKKIPPHAIIVYDVEITNIAQ